MSCLPGERCTAGPQICGIPGEHSHCACGLAIPLGAGYCRMCIHELARGAVMSSQRVVVAEAKNPDLLRLPPGHVNWQRTPYCRRGHEMTEENIYWTTAQNRQRYRCCRACRRVPRPERESGQHVAA